MEYVELFEKSFRDRQDAKDATEENQWLRDIVQDIQGELVDVFNEDTKMYTKELQTCIYSLLEKIMLLRNMCKLL